MNKGKIFFFETTKPKACIFSMKQCLVMAYINIANHAHGVQILYTAGVIGSHRLTLGKPKTSSQKPCGPELLHIVCSNVY